MAAVPKLLIYDCTTTLEKAVMLCCSAAGSPTIRICLIISR